MTEPLRIGICGFGVAGGALAVMLARDGHQVTLLERAPKVGPVGAGFLLQPSGQQILAQLGLFETVARRSARIERLEAFTETGRQLTDLRYGRLARGMCAYGVQRGVLFSVLHEAAAAAGVTITLAAEIAGVVETETDVRVRDVAGREFGPFDLIVGSDGSRSWLRTWLNPSANGRREYIHGALWGSGRLDSPHDALHQVARSARQLLGLLPIGEGRVAFFWGLRCDALDPLRQRGYASFREEVAALCPRALPVVDELGSFEQLSFAGYLHALPRRVHSRRVVLTGDAAHAMSPHLGQGANLALLDAECLARLLAQGPLDEALPRYALERRAHSRYLALLSQMLSPFFQSDSRLLGWGRDLALPLLCAEPWMRRQMELSVAGLKRGFFDRLI
ncbi:monooxygenase FAD-binding [Chthoniobacter flavus Ellin428]|uniref:Monooxygenase FAD-binding n=1 Tax=Chthoniobacter flavus Ellin428 TaxID=497964 RepID=B4D8E4_9BACT|nr:NAD(P)/FAD-dependent oxidoreductase [Chthoniobacter flavus]EDY17337.1 monooxygenase FAD-binding [Chthoniobacter flavus Ellin428]TCO90094.1 2-polyprenyl-6-methoxyphenol hydroxylase-like FAD-dependent oxidoreductase [Chthoniobacter flavus]